MPDRDRLTLDEAAAELNISVRRVRQYIDAGRLRATPPPVHHGWTVTRASVEALKDRKTSPGPQKRSPA